MLIRFFSWWFHELAELAPGSRAGPAHGGQWLQVELGEERIHARLTGGRERALLDLPAGETAELTAQLQAMVAGLDPRRVQCRVAVPARQVLVREVTLPAAAKENLREVLGFEMSRRTPFPVDAVHFDYRIIGQDSAAQTVTVRLEVIPRTVLAPVLAALSAWEPQPAPAPPRDDAADAPIEFAFRGSAFRQGRHSALNAVLAVLVLGLLSLLLWMPFSEQREYKAVLERDLDAVRVEAAEVAALREELTAERDARGLIVGARSGRPAMIVLLEELTRALPDGTFLYRLEVGGNEVNLHGSSDRASGLIGILEASSYLDRVRFASPVTRDGTSGRERFHIVAVVTAGEGG